MPAYNPPSYSARWNSHGCCPIASPSPATRRRTSPAPTRTHGSSVTSSVKCHAPHTPSPNGCAHSSSSAGAPASTRNGWYSAPRGVRRRVASGCSSCSARSNAPARSAACATPGAADGLEHSGRGEGEREGPREEEEDGGGRGGSVCVCAWLSEE